MINIAALKTLSSLAKIKIHFLQAVLITNKDSMQVAALQQNKAYIKVQIEYLDFADIFSFELKIKQLKNSGINKHFIELKEDKQQLYRLIYSPMPLKLESLKIYIKIHLKTGFTKLFKFSADVFILFDKKTNSNLCIAINY